MGGATFGACACSSELFLHLTHIWVYVSLPGGPLRVLPFANGCTLVVGFSLFEVYFEGMPLVLGMHFASKSLSWGGPLFRGTRL